MNINKDRLIVYTMSLFLSFKSKLSKKTEERMNVFSLVEANENIFHEITEIMKDSSGIPRRMCELGFVRGEKIKVIKKSILGRTFLIEISGYVLSVRKSVAQLIMVKL